jgi:hypothetical protein
MMLLVVIAITATGCGKEPAGGRAVGHPENAQAGPAPDAVIVDLPMDSLDNDEMADDVGEGVEGQTVESDR